LSEAEVGKLLAYKARYSDCTANLRGMMLLSLDTGIRAGELVRLRWEDVNVDSGALRIVSGSDRGTTKSGLVRVVHAGQMYPEALAMLAGRERDGALVFPGRGGEVRDGSAISRAMARIADKIGLNEGVTDSRNRVVWHTLRHTYATRMLEAGVDVYILKELMGHHSVTVTELYLHLCDRSKRDRARAAATGQGHLSPRHSSTADMPQTHPEGSTPPLQ
jgi:integrase